VTLWYSKSCVKHYFEAGGTAYRHLLYRGDVIDMDRGKAQWLFTQSNQLHTSKYH